MKVRETLTVVLVLVAMLGLAVLGGCKKDEPVKESAVEITAEYANTKCPIMGSVIKPENVTANLVTEFKGEKVAFCCGACPGKWDALSDEQKVAKLAESK